MAEAPRPAPTLTPTPTPALSALSNLEAIEEAMALDLGPRLVGYISGRVAGEMGRGHGGWGFLLVDRRSGRCLARRSGEKWTTGPRVLLMATLELMRSLRGPGQEIEIRTEDPDFLQMGQRWIPAWRQRGWTKRGGQEIQNLDLIRPLDALLLSHRASWRLLPSHSPDEASLFARDLVASALDALEAGADPEKTTRYSEPPIQLPPT